MSQIPPAIDPRIHEADQALAAGNVPHARQLLEAVAETKPANMDFWIKLASLRRMSKDIPAALVAVDHALKFDPLDFMALLFRANLLEMGNDPRTGEAYGHALAQRPPEALPATIEASLERGAKIYAAHQDAIEAKLSTVVSTASPGLSSFELSRSERFISNISRRTRTYHSDPTHFYYPHLREIEFHDRADFPWLSEWEASIDVISEEFSALIAAEGAELVPYIQYAGNAPLAQWRDLNHSRKWTSIHLIQRGLIVEPNARHCPETIALLSRFPQPRIKGCGANAMFSLLAPHTKIPPHTGVANFRLVCHLPLIVPENCEFRVGETVRQWQRGEAFVFDDTIEHEARNDSDELRVIMIIDCWHPDLTPADKYAITAIVGEAALQNADF